MTSNQTAGYVSMGADINKAPETDTLQETTQGVVGPKLPELELEKKDKDIITLTKKWAKDWNESEVKSRWEKMCDESEKYWFGEQFDKPSIDKTRPNVDNIIFESLETYLPQVTRRNPEPLVSLASNEDKDKPENQEYVRKVKDKLADIADANKIRLKLKRATRHWSIYLLGVAKAGWDLDKDIPTVRIVRPKKLILDPKCSVDEDGYAGNRIGEYRKMEASTIINIIEKEKDSAAAVKAIKDKVKDDLATELQFIEWWTPEYMCWTMDEHVLLKKKNPHWNYSRVETEESVDDYGNAVPVEKKMEGINHLPVPGMPYIFMAVFNLGDQPVDRTSLIYQNLANQDRINKRNRQVDENVDNMNNGFVVSLERSGLTESQAKRVATSLRKGGMVVIPAGSAQEAVYKPPAQGLPGDVYNDLVDTRNRVRDIFGTRGSAPAGIESETTVRGKILNKGLDTDRIGGGVSEYIEQFADDIYNWFVQLLYVYDDDFQFLAGAKPPKIVVSVKEGSLLPTDSTTIANQAIELASAGKMSTIDMYKRLEYPNPEELAANVWLEANAPQLLFKDNPLVAEALQMQAQAAEEAAMQEAEKKSADAYLEVEKERAKQQAQTGANVAEATGEQVVPDVLSQVPIQ